MALPLLYCSSSETISIKSESLRRENLFSFRRKNLCCRLRFERIKLNYEIEFHFARSNSSVNWFNTLENKWKTNFIRMSLIQLNVPKFQLETKTSALMNLFTWDCQQEVNPMNAFEIFGTKDARLDKLWLLNRRIVAENVIKLMCSANNCKSSRDCFSPNAFDFHLVAFITTNCLR